MQTDFPRPSPSLPPTCPLLFSALKVPRRLAQPTRLPIAQWRRYGRILQVDIPGTSVPRRLHQCWIHVR